MAYQSDTIATVLNRLNRQYFLPAIQREFVWTQEQIIALFDSIMRRYPIGSLLLWQVQPENRQKWEVYEFVDQFVERMTHNQRANTNGVLQMNLVLDGQQRLTSLLIGLRGSYAQKRKYKRIASSDAWSKQKLYIDLLRDPKGEEEDEQVGAYYGFAFHSDAPVPTTEHYWFEVGRILDFDSEDRFDRFRQDECDKLPDCITRAQQRVFERNLNRLYNAVWRDEMIAYYTETNQDADRVLDIFVRANDGGTKLSKSDLLLSMVTSQWGGASAREEIFSCVDHMNSGLMRRNNFDKDFVMKTCLVVSDLAVTYKVENFTTQNLDHIRLWWPNIKKAMLCAVDLVNSYGIDGDTLTSSNAIIPIVYFLYGRSEGALRSDSAYDRRNAEIIRRWLIGVLLNGVFGSLGDNVQKAAREVLHTQRVQNSGDDFPAELINKALQEAGKSPEFDEFAIDKFLDIQYRTRQSFLALSLLYDETRWGTLQFQQDHIYPRSMFTTTKMSERGIQPNQQIEYQRCLNRIGNLQLLVAHENAGKSDDSIEEWLITRDDNFRTRHLIPVDDEVLDFACFLKFIDAREDLIRQRLRRIMGLNNL